MRDRRMKQTRSVARVSAWILLLTACCGFCDVLLTEDFEAQGAWRRRVDGTCTIELVPGGHDGKCVKIHCPQKGTAYYTIDLGPELIRGRRLKVRAMVRTQDVAQGEQVYSTAKFHVGGRSAGKAFNRAKWFTGTHNWREETFLAPIPDDIEKPVFDLAIQGTTGTVWFDSLVIDDGLQACIALDLKAVANTSLSDGVADDGAGGFLDTGSKNLRDVPRGDVTLGGADFRILPSGQNHGATCVVLRGAERPTLPDTPVPAKSPGNAKPTPAIVPVKFKGKGLLFLQAAGWVDAKRSEPCLVYEVTYADGQTVDVPVMEGRDIGAFDAPADLPNWRVVWTMERPGGTVGIGVMRWSNPRPDVTMESVALRTPGAGAVPVVLGISLDRTGRGLK